MQQPDGRKTLSSTDAENYIDRWRYVRELELKALRRMTPAQKLSALADLMEAARQMGWSTELEAEDRHARDLWTCLRRQLGRH